LEGWASGCATDRVPFRRGSPSEMEPPDRCRGSACRYRHFLGCNGRARERGSHCVGHVGRVRLGNRLRLPRIGMTLTRIGILMSPTGLAHPDTLTGLITNVMEDGETNSRSLALMSQAETEFQSLLTKSTSSTFHCSRYFRYWSSIFRMSLEFSMVCFRPGPPFSSSLGFGCWASRIRHRSLLLAQTNQDL
jgi:hypothetical protein